MAFYGNLFWVSLVMQSVQGLSALDVAIRLLPQAFVGLCVSPLIAFGLHIFNNTLVMGAAAMLQIGGAILLLFVRRESPYFALIFPSLILSTIGMDWSLNVGTV